MVEEVVIAPAWYAAIPFLGFAILTTLSIAKPSDDGTSRTKVWPAFPAIYLLFAAVMTLLGNFEGGLNVLIIFTVALFAMGFVAIKHDWIRQRVSDAGPVAIVIRDVVCFVGIVVCCLLALELPWNTTFPALTTAGMLIELALIAGIQLSLYFLGLRTGNLMAAGILLAGLAGISQSFLIKFKGVSLLPSDLLAMGTAFSVSEGYSYVFGASHVWGTLAVNAGLMLASLLGKVPQPKPSREERVVRRQAALLSDRVSEEAPADQRKGTLKRVLLIVLQLLLGAGCATGVYFGITRLHATRNCGIEFDYWHTVEQYSENGFLTSFVTAFQDFPIKRPVGYTKTKAQDALEELSARYEKELAHNEARDAAVAQFEEEKPTIIVVMNETFADLSVFDQLRCGYEGPTYFKSVSDALTRGNLAVSVIGGGTCNTEFEFLTGNSYAFVGAGKYPYVTYDLAPYENLARILGEQGYITHAIHPNEPSNWGREEVYTSMGFDEMHFIDEFEGAPELHMGVTDAATYDKILEILQLDTHPQFVFDVTMQNHSSYNLGNIPEDKLVNYQPEGDIAEADVAQLNEYLSCIQASDQDLEAFMGKLKELDRKVVLVFFGDHQPAFTPVFNDLYFPDEDDVIHQERTHQSCYYVWANYDVAGVEQKSAVDDSSADVLGAQTLYMIGAPLTTYQKARLAARADVPALNLYGYLGADLNWYGFKAESAYQDTFSKVSWINHLNFGSKVQP